MVVSVARLHDRGPDGGKNSLGEVARADEAGAV